MRTPFAIAVAALCLAAPVAAQDAGPAEPQAQATLQAIRTDDPALTCIQLGDQAAQLSQIMGREPEGSLFGRLGGVVKAGAAMLIPGAGLAIAGTDAVTQPGRDRAETADRVTENRWHYLNGLYAGRRCHEQAEAQVAASTPPPAAQAAVTTPAALQPAAAAVPLAGVPVVATAPQPER